MVGPFFPSPSFLVIATTTPYSTATQSWIDRFVIRLNLCPFARHPFQQGLIRYSVTLTQQPTALAQVLATEAKLLATTPPSELETTLLIHPHCLTDFLDYNDFLDVADGVLTALELTGVLQIASFHPQYQFAGTAPEDVENYTNRSPYPMLHLLREDSVAQARRQHPDVEAIPDRNIALLKKMGLDTIREITTII